MRIKPLLIALAALAVGFFAVEGGEFGTSDLLTQRRRRDLLRTRVDSLHRLVDSLRAQRDSIRTSPAVQERIAREEFGMVRGDRELLYRFSAPADSTDSAAVRRP